MEQTNKMLDTMWGNWESGMQKVYDSGQEFGKISIEAFKKNQEMITLMSTNLKEVEEEMKSSLNNMTQSFKENSKTIQNEDAGRILENWNEKMNDIFNRLQQLSVTPRNGMLIMLEQSQERMIESVKKVAEEQQKFQTEARGNMENFLSQVKESQNSFMKMMEEQTKQTLDKVQPK